MKLALAKVHGSGNDFPLIDARDLALADEQWQAMARALSDRAGLVGGDGLLLLTEGAGGAAFGMRMFNPDGSEAETCLNGLRCVARAGLAATGLSRAQVGLKTSIAEVAAAPPLAPGVRTIEERAGPATLDLRRWPLHGGPERLVDRPVPQLSDTLRFTAVAIPNPHLVAFVDQVDVDELVRVGLLCEAAPAWLPNRANVSFVEVRGRAKLFVRTHERGAGLTNACGSAMAAATYAAGLTGRIAWGTEVTVRNPGGLVRARAEADGHVTLLGNATLEWEGSVELDGARAHSLEVTARHDDEIAAWAAATRS